MFNDCLHQGFGTTVLTVSRTLKLTLIIHPYCRMGAQGSTDFNNSLTTSVSRLRLSRCPIVGWPKGIPGLISVCAQPQKCCD
jgi:hypothetical protein